MQSIDYASAMQEPPRKDTRTTRKLVVLANEALSMSYPILLSAGNGAEGLAAT
jgi:hypothetical protein